MIGLLRLRLKSRKQSLITMCLVITLLSSLFFLLFHLEAIVSPQNLGERLKRTSDFVGDTSSLNPDILVTSGNIDGDALKVLDVFDEAVNDSLQSVFHQEDVLTATEIKLTFLLAFQNNAEMFAFVHVLKDDTFLQILEQINESWIQYGNESSRFTLMVHHSSITMPQSILENQSINLQDASGKTVTFPINRSVTSETFIEKIKHDIRFGTRLLDAQINSVDIILPESFARLRFEDVLTMNAFESFTGGVWLQDSITYEIIFSKNPEKVLDEFKIHLTDRLSQNNLTLQLDVHGEIYSFIDNVKPVKEPIRIQIKLIRVVLWFLGITTLISSVTWSRYQKFHEELELAQLLTLPRLAFIRVFEGILITVSGVTLGFVLSTASIMVLSTILDFKANFPDALSMFPWIALLVFVTFVFSYLVIDFSSTRQQAEISEIIEENSVFIEIFKKIIPFVAPIMLLYLFLDVNVLPTITVTIDFLSIFIALLLLYLCFLNVSVFATAFQLFSTLARKLWNDPMRKFGKQWYVISKVWNSEWRRQIFGVIAILTFLIAFSSAMTLIADLYVNAEVSDNAGYQFALSELSEYNESLVKELQELPEVSAALTELWGKGDLGTKNHVFTNDISLQGLFPRDLLDFFPHDIVVQLNNQGIIKALESSETVIVSSTLKERYPMGSKMTIWYHDFSTNEIHSLNLTVSAILDDTIQGIIGGDIIINADLFLELFTRSKSPYEVTIYLKTHDNPIEAYQSIKAVMNDSTGVLIRRVSLELWVISKYGLTIPLFIGLLSLVHLILAISIIESGSSVSRSKTARLIALLSLSKDSSGKKLLIRRWFFEVGLLIATVLGTIFVTLTSYVVLLLLIISYLEPYRWEFDTFILPTASDVLSATISSLFQQAYFLIMIIVLLLFYQIVRLIHQLRTFNLPMVLRHYE